MIRNLLTTARRWWVNFLKRGEDFTDLFKPRGEVEARLIYAHGPRKGEVARVIHGRNIVTSWLSSGGAAPTSGRDLLRRILAPAAFSGSLAADADATIQQAWLGSGTTAETSSDEGLETLIGGSEKIVSDVVFDALNPYVTFVFEWDESEVNVSISEAGLLSGRDDFIARKTFGTFTKTSDFTLEIRWTIRF